YSEGVTLMRQAGMRTEKGEFNQALDLLDEARKVKEQTGEIEDLARIQYSRAGLYLKLDRPDEALSEIEKTIAIIESQRLGIDKFDSRAQYFASVHEYYARYIQVLMALHRLHPDEKYDQRAFEAAEKSKVRALLDQLQHNQRISSCDELLAEESGTRYAPPRATSASAQDVASAQALTLAEIQAEIGDGETVLLEYALGDDQSYAWIVDREKISTFELGPAAEIRKSARSFRETLMPLQAREGETSIDYLQRRREAKSKLLVQSKHLASLLLGPLDLPA